MNDCCDDDDDDRQLKSITFSNDPACVFYQYPTVNVSTPDASTTVAISLAAGTWSISLDGAANKGFRDVGLGFEITAETPTGPVLEESSNTVPFQVGPEQNYTFSMTFDNTIANSSVWFQYVGPFGGFGAGFEPPQESRGMVVVVVADADDVDGRWRHCRFRNDIVDIPAGTYLPMSVGLFYNSSGTTVELVTVFSIICA